MEEWLLTEVGNSEKLYLLHGRKESRNGTAPVTVALKMRNYHDATTPKHRDAMVSIALSTHNLAVERLRWVRSAIDHENRLCQMCMTHVETPEHVLFRCAGNENGEEVPVAADDRSEEAKVVEKMHDLTCGVLA